MLYETSNQGTVFIAGFNAFKIANVKKFSF